MSELEILGALLVKSMGGSRKNEKLEAALDSAGKTITTELRKKQYELWDELGGPTFVLLGDD